MYHHYQRFNLEQNVIICNQNFGCDQIKIPQIPDEDITKKVDDNAAIYFTYYSD